MPDAIGSLMRTAWDRLILQSLAAVAVGATIGYCTAPWVGVVSGLLVLLSSFGSRTTAGLLVVGAGLALALSGDITATQSPVASSGATGAAPSSFADQVALTIPVELSTHHRANWTVTVVSINVLQDRNLRFNLRFENESAVLGSPLQATPANTYLEDVTGARHGLVQHSGSWLEDPIYRQNVRPGDSVDTYIVLAPPADLTLPFTFHYSDYPAIVDIQLAAGPPPPAGR